MKKNIFLTLLAVVTIIFTLRCDDTSAETGGYTLDEIINYLIDDSSTAEDSTWSSKAIDDKFKLVDEKFKVITGEYEGGPAYASGDPFCFNINDLADNIDDSKVFVVASGFKTASAGNILSTLQITWNVTTIGSDHIVELYVEDEDGNPYENPLDINPWSTCSVKLKFHAYYVPEMPKAVFVD